MNCADFEPLVNAWVDGEIAVDQEKALRDHLAECAACTALTKSVRSMNQDLETLFSGAVCQVPDSSLFSASNIAAQSACVSSSAQPRANGTSNVSRSSLAAWICATAAALLVLAFSWERPGNQNGSNALAAQPAARLIVATGEVTMKDPLDESIITCAPQTEVPPGWVVITGENSRCELSNSAEMPIRLDQNSELKQMENNTVRLEKGRMWASAKQDFCLESPTANVATKNATFDFSCAADNSTILNVYEGEVDVTDAKGSNMQVRAGQSVHLGDGGMRSLATADPVLETRWINDILMKKGQEDQELIDRVEWLWIQVAAKDPGQASAYESELRTLGSCAVRPLCDWVQSSESLAKPSRRGEAAKLLSDLAGPDAIPRLIQLLEDDDGDVRFHAAVALERLTGESHGGTPEEWRVLPSPVRQKARGSWNRWWDDKTKDG